MLPPTVILLNEGRVSCGTRDCAISFASVNRLTLLHPRVTPTNNRLPLFFEVPNDRTEYAHTTKKVKCSETLTSATARFCREMYDSIHEVIHNAVPHAWEGTALQPACCVF